MDKLKENFQQLYNCVVEVMEIDSEKAACSKMQDVFGGDFPDGKDDEPDPEKKKELLSSVKSNVAPIKPWSK